MVKICRTGLLKLNFESRHRQSVQNPPNPPHIVALVSVIHITLCLRTGVGWEQQTDFCIGFFFSIYSMAAPHTHKECNLCARSLTTFQNTVEDKKWISSSQALQILSDTYTHTKCSSQGLEPEKNLSVCKIWDVNFILQKYF